jgi:hypothetical protein
MASALPSNALYDVQKYLRQKRATGAQVTPQNERAAWSGYFDTMAQNSLAERASAMNQERLNMTKDALKAQEGADKISGVGQLVSTVGQGAMLLKGTDIGSKFGLGTPKATPTATSEGIGTTTATAPVTATGGAASVGGAAPTGAAYSTGAAELAGTEAAGTTAAAAGSEAGITAAAPFTSVLAPATAGLAAGTMLANLTGASKQVEVPVGALGGAAAGAAIGSIVPGPGTAVGAIIGAVAGGIGAKVK